MVATAGLRDGFGEPRASCSERIPGRRESDLEGQTSLAAAAIQLRAHYARRDRKTAWTESASRSCLCGETRDYPCLVSTARCPEVRRLQTPAVSGPSSRFIGSRSLGGPDGAGELRLGL